MALKIEIGDIEVGKVFQDRRGRSVRIIAADVKSTYPVIGLVEGECGNEYVGLYRYTGESISGRASDLVNPTENLKDNDLVFVRNSNSESWVRRHFAGWSDSGKAFCYFAKRSKWTAQGQLNPWEQVRVPTGEELETIMGNEAHVPSDLELQAFISQGKEDSNG